MNVPLNIPGSIILDAGGNGTVKIGPSSAREVWHPSNVHVSVKTNVNEATCAISVGDVNTRSFRDETFTGSSGDSTDKVNADVIKVGQYVWAQWTGGDAGALATLTVTGTRDI